MIVLSSYTDLFRASTAAPTAVNRCDLAPACGVGRRLAVGSASVGLVVALSLILVAKEASAQTYSSEIRIDQMQVAGPDSPFTRAEGPYKPFDAGIAYAFRFSTDYGLRPLLSSIDHARPDEETPPGGLPDGEDVALVEHALLLHFGASLDPIDWLSFDLNMVAAAFESGQTDDRIAGQSRRAGEAGLGDLRLGVHGRIVRDTALGFQVGTRVWVPTGSVNAYTKGRSTKKGAVPMRWEISPAVAGDVEYLIYGCSLGLAPLFFAGRDGARLAASCAAMFKAVPGVLVGFEPHVAVFSYSDGESTPGMANAEYALQFEPMASAALSVSDFRFGLAAGIGLGNAPGTAQARVMFSVGYAAVTEPALLAVVQEVPDDDLDGISNAEDRCPNDAGDKERGGCPSDSDVDGDGIAEDDACPDAAGAAYDDPKANGCPDSDNDRLADPVDNCPQEPGAASPPRVSASPSGSRSQVGAAGGYAWKIGCPLLVRLRGSEFVFRPAIAFLPGTAIIAPKVRAALIEMIGTMRVKPDGVRVSVMIGNQGATPAVGQSRVEALRKLFDEQTFSASRFQLVLDLKKSVGSIAAYLGK